VAEPPPPNSDVSVTDVPLCNASTSFCTLSGVQATVENWVFMRSTTAEPSASICCTRVVTCVSLCEDDMLDMLDIVLVLLGDVLVVPVVELIEFGLVLVPVVLEVPPVVVDVPVALRVES